MHEKAYRTAQVQRLQELDGETSLCGAEDFLATEVPVALVFNGISHAVMMASPLDIEDFARGFCLSERIVENKAQIYGIEIFQHAIGIEVRLDIASQAFAILKQKRRALAGRTGCGVCGVESIAALDFDLPKVASEIRVALPAILQAQQQMQQQQTNNLLTGAVHAAAWVSLAGEIVLLREDVGRHNALDKLIGAMSCVQTPDGFCLMTSRASYELVQKAARANIALLATVSAPTSLAVQMAEQANITLLGFVREQRAVVYAHGARLILHANLA